MRAKRRKTLFQGLTSSCEAHPYVVALLTVNGHATCYVCVQAILDVYHESVVPEFDSKADVVDVGSTLLP